MPRYKLMVGRFPYQNTEDSRLVDWLIGAAVKLDRDKRFEVCYARKNDTPITMTRNAMIDAAIREGVDILLMIDSDTIPDIELGEDPDAKPFLESSLEFMLDHHGPCIVGAPYCGPPPVENVYVFQWGNKANDDPDNAGSLDQYTREQAATFTGIREVAALPTGCMAIDMRAFTKYPIKHPYTYYEWKGDGPPCVQCGSRKPGPQMEKGSTEDVTMTRDLSIAGVKQYCNWDAWAGHVKSKVVRKPRPWTSDFVADKMKEAVLRGTKSGERLREVKPGRFAADVAAAFAAGPASVACNHTAPVVTAAERARVAGQTPVPPLPDRQPGQAFPIPGYGGMAMTGTTAPTGRYDLDDIARRFQMNGESGPLAMHPPTALTPPPGGLGEPTRNGTPVTLDIDLEFLNQIPLGSPSLPPAATPPQALTNDEALGLV